MKWIVQFALIAALLPGGVAAQAARTGDEVGAAHRERVQQAWQEYEAALLDGDAARARSMYSEDVTIRGASGTLHGRAAYRDRVERFPSTTSLEYLKGEVEGVIVMGDLALGPPGAAEARG